MMECKEYREKFIHEKLTESERDEFKEHLKDCAECRAFVENYNKMKEFMKVRTEFKSSGNLKSKIVSKVKFRNRTRLLFKIALPTAAVIVFGTFYVSNPFSANRVAYEKVASTGIKMLNSSYATPVNSQSNLDYLVKIKYASDQF